MRDGLRIKRDGLSGLIELQAVHFQIDAARIEGNLGVTGSRDNSAPIGIVAGDRRLDQSAIGDGFGNLTRSLARRS